MISEINKANFKLILIRLHVILKTKSKGQAEWLNQLIGELQANSMSAFLIKLNGVEMWGGSGAVWEVGDFYSKEEEREFQLLIIQLVELMIACEKKNKGAIAVLKLFKRLNK